LSIFLGQAVLAGLVGPSTPVLHGVTLTPGRLPHGLDLYGMSVALEPR
jgi:hypothetical protein